MSRRDGRVIAVRRPSVERRRRTAFQMRRISAVEAVEAVSPSALDIARSIGLLSAVAATRGGPRAFVITAIAERWHESTAGRTREEDRLRERTENF